MIYWFNSKTHKVREISKENNRYRLIYLTDNSVFDGIKNIVANLRNCDEVLNQIIK